MASFSLKVFHTVKETTSLPHTDLERLRSNLSEDGNDQSITTTLTDLATSLHTLNHVKEATVIELVLEKAIDSPSHGGLGIDPKTPPPSSTHDEVLFLISAHLTTLLTPNRDYLSTIPQPHPSTHPMTLAQKIFSQHVLGHCPPTGLTVGSVTRVGLDWILASELSWSEMARTYQKLGAPGIWRNDRFWLAGDHLVHPDVMSDPKIKKMVDVSEKAKRDFKMTDYQGMNYTIMHTEFVRERAEPGMLCVGSDSHTCSGGAVGCLSIGLGAADVMLALALGETWFKVPESVKIEFRGKPRWGVSGKDVILHILGKLKRNTYASERIVEFMGEGCQWLSVDARFAICNMCTEFGAITGTFVPDAVTRDYVQRRRRKGNKQHSIYFKPDDGAKYASEHVIDLSEVESTIAVYPEPDNIVPVSEKAGMHVDGVFIGACTTTEEELVLAALVLKAGLEKGWSVAKGKRHYVPGSLPIVDRLEKLGLLQIYEEAGFTRGPPGCSYCVGLSAEKAEKGETWLSSQNRNFANRMGHGSFGNLSSAVVCAASAFSMTITDPASLIADIDNNFFEKQYKGLSKDSSAPSGLTYVEPDLRGPQHESKTFDSPTTKPDSTPNEIASSSTTIKSHIITLPSFIDTDALAPGPTLATCITEEDFGQHVLEHTHPNFRSTLKSAPYKSSAVVVAGEGFGVGSSRECAVSALKGAGVKCVIAKSFAFIFARNLPSLGLWGFTMPVESDFWDEVYRDEMNEKEIEVDLVGRKVKVNVGDKGWKEWDFELSEMEYQLTMNKGVTESFNRLGRGIWAGMMKDGEKVKVSGGGRGGNSTGEDEMGNEPNEIEKKMEW